MGKIRRFANRMALIFGLLCGYSCGSPSDPSNNADVRQDTAESADYFTINSESNNDAPFEGADYSELEEICNIETIAGTCIGYHSYNSFVDLPVERIGPFLGRYEMHVDCNGKVVLGDESCLYVAPYNCFFNVEEQIACSKEDGTQGVQHLKCEKLQLVLTDCSDILEEEPDRPRTEVCNGNDDDLDGKTDEDLIMQCYTGPAGTEDIGICHGGYTICENGGWTVCTDQQVPIPEFCNGVDENCDGIPDDGYSSGGVYVDFILGVDTSGSMEDNISAVANALAQFLYLNIYTDANNEPYSLFAVALVPGYASEVEGASVYNYSDVVLAQNLEDAMTTAEYLLATYHNSGAGNEPSYDFLYLIAQPDNPLGINWRDYAKKVAILFTDEEGQSYLEPPITRWDTYHLLNTTGITVYVFGEEEHYNDFEFFVHGDGVNNVGAFYIIQSNTVPSSGTDDIVDKLQGLINEATQCIPDDENQYDPSNPDESND